MSILLCQGLRPQSLPLRVQIQELAREQSGDAEPEPGHGGCEERREILKTLLVDINTRQVGFNCEIKYHLISRKEVFINVVLSTHKSDNLVPALRGRKVDWCHPLTVDHVRLNAGDMGQEEADQVSVTSSHCVMERTPTPGTQREVGVTALLLEEADHILGAALLTSRE